MIDGRVVAVKVQRPEATGQISLDLHVLRMLTPLPVILKNILGRQKTSKKDIDSTLALVDEWGRGLVAELDYRLEGKNCKEFAEMMARRGLDAVTAPKVIFIHPASHSFLPAAFVFVNVVIFSIVLSYHSRFFFFAFSCIDQYPVMQLRKKDVFSANFPS